MKPLEFEITIQRKSDGYWPIDVRVKNLDGLTTQAKGRFQLSEDDFQELTEAQDNEKEYGTLLGKQLFREDVGKTFIRNLSKSSQDCPLRIMLSNETDDKDELRKLHWERLCAPIDADGTWNLLARDQRVPYSQYISTIIDRPFPPIGRNDLRALVLVASPSNLGKYQLDPFDVEAAVSSVRGALGEIPCAVLANNIEGAIGPPTLEELSKQLTNAQEPYTLLHFVCHGRVLPDGETALYWAKEDNQLKQVTGTQLLEELGYIGGQRHLPHFAFLCTCESAAPRAEGAFGGLAQRLVRDLGMPAVVAMTRKVSVQTALALGQNFYRRLRVSGKVDVALQEATAGLGNRSDITVPALFSRLGGTPLFSDLLATDETIGKQYEGYETENEVRKVVGEYTQQPFAGRSEEQDQINQFLAQNASGILLLTAPAGFGKSSLLMHWQQTRQEDCFIAFHCFRTSPSVLRSVPNAYRHLLRRLYVYYNRSDLQFSSDLRSQIRGLVDHPEAQSGKRLVIVLDGLDEAQETFEPFLSSPLPDGVFIIASARAGEGDEPEYLQGWTTNAQRLHLKRLPREAIQDWLAKIKELAPYAQDNSFIEKLDEVTIGFPLYLRYLLDDLKQAVDNGNDVQALLTNSPMGFEEYVKKQFGQLTKDVKQQTEVRELFVLLSAALGSLSADDIEALTGLGAWDLPTLPWQVTRWFSIRSDSYSFAHPLLAHQFQVALGPKLIAQAKKKLIDYCANWKENNSPYALRYYAEHLQKAEQLYELARNEEFAAAQREKLPDEPGLPLNAVKLALQGKAQEDKADGMAEFMLLHARRKIQIAQVSPLNALRAGSLEAAWRLAAQSNREDCILWHLLLAWALVAGDEQHKPDLEKTRETLGRLQSMQLPRLSGWKAKYAVYLLGQILPVIENHPSLVKQVLDDEGLMVLCGEMIKHKPGQTNSLKVALTTAQQIEDSGIKADALIAIAKAQAEAGDSAAALTTLNIALTTAQLIESSYSKADALIAIAKAQAEAGDTAAALTTLNIALTTALQIEDSYYGSQKADVLTAIAKAQTKVGDLAAALTTLNIALTTAQQMEDSYSKAEALRAIAETQTEVGDTAAALTTLNTALTTALQIKDSGIKVGGLGIKAYALRAIAKAQTKAGDPVAALNTAQLIEDLSDKAEVQGDIAKAQAEAADPVAALTTAQQIEYPYFKAEALAAVAKAQTEAADPVAAQTTLNTALTTVQQIENSWFKADALRAIAETQAEVGDTAAALTTLNIALTTTQQIENSWFKADALRAIAETQTEAGDRAAALTTLNTALTTAQQIEDSYYGSQKADVLTAISKAQTKVGDTAAALTTAQQIQDSDSKAAALCDIAKAQAEAGDLVTALTTAQLIEDSDFKADADIRDIAQLIEDSSFKADALIAIAKAQAEAGDPAAAQTTLNTALTNAQQIEDSDFKADALTAIAKAQVKAGYPAAALTTAQQIENSWFKSAALYDIAKAQTEAGDPAAALTTLNIALTTVQQIEDSDSKAAALCDIAKAQTEAEDPVTAQMTLNAALISAQQIEDSSRKAAALCDIAIAQAEAGEALLNQDINKSPKPSKFCQRLCEIILSFSKTAGDPAAAQMTLNIALTTAQQIEDSDSKVYALTAIAKAQAKAGDSAAALTTAQQIEDAFRKADALIAIAKAQAEAGDSAAALTTAQQIESSYSKADALIAIAKAQAEAGDTAAALTTLNIALTTAQLIESPIRKPVTLSEIAKAQAEAADPVAALTTAQQIEDSYYGSQKADALIAIAKAQTKVGDLAAALTTLNTALTTAQQIEDSDSKAYALCDIAKAQTEVGDTAAALTTLNIALTTAQQIEDSDSKANTLGDIAKAQAKAKSGEQAVAIAEQILIDRNTLLPEIAAALVEEKDEKYFKQLLLPCADYPDAAYKMCGYLAQLYPKQATAVAEEVSKFSVNLVK